MLPPARFLVKPSLSGRDHAAYHPQARTIGNFSYIIADPPTGEAWLVDPAWDIEELIAQIEQLDCLPTAVLLTHSHPDHCGGHLLELYIPGINDLPEIFESREWKPIPIFLHSEDLKTVAIHNPSVAEWLRPISQENAPSLAGEKLQFLHTPGHTPGSICYMIDGALFSGDTLFHNGHGRTDLPGGNEQELEHSLKIIQEELDKGWKLHPGHDY